MSDAVFYIDLICFLVHIRL